MSKLPATIHDAFFKQVIGDPVMADRFLRERLPPDVVALLAPGLPELIHGSFVDEDLGQHHSDLLFRVGLTTGGDALVLIVVEHKSSPDRLARLQLGRYDFRILVDWYNKNQRLPLPVVVPLLAYHGSESWAISTEFTDLFGSVPEALLPYVPSFRHVLIDLSKIDDHALSQHFRLRAFLKALKYILRQDLPERIDIVLAEASYLTVADIVLILTYLGRGPVAVGEDKVRAALQRSVPAQEEEVMASFGQHYFEDGKTVGLALGITQGITQGEAKGKADMLLRQLGRRFGPLSMEIEARVRAANSDQLDEWSDRLLDARRLADVFDPPTQH